MPLDSLSRPGNHSGRVYAVAYLPDVKVLTSASSDNTVWPWGAITGARKQKLKINITITSILFSEDGRYLKTDGG
jgi:WD40 repeat protein